jgi:hypothetical protein
MIKEIQVLPEDAFPKMGEALLDELANKVGYAILDVEYTMEDLGYGEYHFWGMCGIHIDEHPNITEINSQDARIQAYINEHFEEVKQHLEQYLYE